MPGVRLVNARLPCPPYVAARIEFQTISGDNLCSVEKRLPCWISYSEMRALLEFDGFFEVMNENFEPVDLERGLHFRQPRRIPNNGDVTNESVYKVVVVLLPYKFVNLRIDPNHPCGCSSPSRRCDEPGYTGHRRWYKEFWEFAASGTFPLPTASVVFKNKEDYHKVIASIMQFKASEFRYREMRQFFTHPNIRSPRRRLSSPEPNGRLWRAGVHHSIMLRTKAAHATAILWVDQWLDLNEDVVLELGKLIHSHPLQSYFA